MIALFLSTLAGIAVAADCPETLNSAELAELLRTAEDAAANMDTAAFETSSAELRAMTPCLNEVVAPSLAARFHRFSGLQAFLVRDFETSQVAFAAARRIEPLHQLLNASPPLLEAYTARDDAIPTLVAPFAAEGTLFFDGSPTAERPLGVPTLAQLQRVDGSLLWSVALPPGGDLPAYTVGVPEPVREPLNGSLIGLGAALVAGSAATYGLAWGTRARYLDEATPMAELDGLRTRVGILVGVSSVLLVGGGAVGVAGVL